MRMWKVDVSKMCRQHLLGEHNEIGMFIGSINKGISMKGYLEKGLLEIHNLYSRHEELKNEMIRRGYKHQSELPTYGKSLSELMLRYGTLGKVDSEANVLELKRRCPKCKFR